MTELVTLKQQGSVDHFHDQFVSILNQLHLPEPYALSIFISNLKMEVGQYLRLFKPQTLLEAFMLARQVEGIVSVNMVKRPPPMGGNAGYSKPLFPTPKPISPGSASGGLSPTYTKPNHPFTITALQPSPYPKPKWRIGERKGYAFGAPQRIPLDINV